MRKYIKILPFAVVFVLLLLPTAVSALTFTDTVGETYKTATKEDRYTLLYNQDLSFIIKKIVNSRGTYSGTIPIENYNNNHTQAEDWHCEKNQIGGQINFLSEIFVTDEKAPALTTYELTLDKYPEVAANSSESLKFIHYANVGYNGEHFPATAWHELPGMTIGEVSFDVMVHLQVDNTKFYFELNNLLKNSKMVEGYFEVHNLEDEGAPNSYRIRAFIVLPYNTSNGDTDIISVYNATADNYNWIHVNIFFDTWNDLYNITFYQYTSDWKPLDTPVSYAVRGEQHTADFSARTNVGRRLSPSNLLNRLEFNLISDAVGQTSKAWVDNIAYRYYEFPAVYADVIYDNATFRLEYNEPLKYMNDTIIVSYEPPQYPHPFCTPLMFYDGYFNNVTRPGLLTGWEKAPTWMYVIPYVVPTDNRTLVVNTLMNYLNDSKNVLEERGTLKPDPVSPYALGELGPFHAMDFKFNEENSTDFTYYFDSGNTNYTIKIAYRDDLANMGVFKEFKMYTGDERSPGIINYWSESTVITPGYNIVALLGVAALTVFFIYRKTLRRER